MRASIKTLFGSMVFGVSLLTAAPTLAESDKQLQEKALKAREMMRMGDHAGHAVSGEKSPEFRGVFYGYLPCDNCAGIKTTLSLKNKNNYLLVTQYAKQSTREFYDKGKYSWNDETRTVILTSKKDSSIRRYRIEDEGTLIQLKPDGSPMPGNQDDYALRRSDTVKSREVHIH